jgi:two-component sensor histidine kinase
LLRELGHRTQNNLAMVISVLSLQARSKTTPETRAALEKAVARVQAVASAHQHFKPEKQNGQVAMRSYLEELCRHLGDSLRDVRPIAVKVESDDVHLRTEQAVPLGLIANELVTNALKHAFPEDRSGAVRVVLSKTNSLALTVEDNGVGCPTDKQEHIGSRLTRLLAEQMKPSSPGRTPDRDVASASSSPPTTPNCGVLERTRYSPARGGPKYRKGLDRFWRNAPMGSPNDRFEGWTHRGRMLLD